MRLLRYVLLELCLGVAALVGTALVVSSAASAISRALEERARAELLRRYPSRHDISTPPEPAVGSDQGTTGAGSTFLGMSDDLLLSRVRGQPITKVKLNKGGSSLSFRVDFADGSRAAFKPAQTNLQTIPRKEVAAYRINRLLGLSGVPPAAPRAVSRDELLSHLHPESLAALPRIKAETIFNPLGVTNGVVSYWIPEIKDSGLDTPEGARESLLWLALGQVIPPDRTHIAAQLSDLIVFDFLTANPDRYSGGNIKMSPDGDHLYFMDNTMAFFLNPEGHQKNRDLLLRTQRFSRRLVRALDRLTVPALTRLEREDDGQEILTPSEIRAVVSRREAAQRHIHALISQHGESNILVFP